MLNESSQWKCLTCNSNLLVIWNFRCYSILYNIPAFYQVHYINIYQRLILNSKTTMWTCRSSTKCYLLVYFSDGWLRGMEHICDNKHHTYIFYFVYCLSYCVLQKYAWLTRVISGSNFIFLILIIGFDAFANFNYCLLYAHFDYRLCHIELRTTDIVKRDIITVTL